MIMCRLMCSVMIETEGEKIGIIIEVKYAENGRFESACSEAMKQIEEDRYAAVLKEHGMCKILKYGIACYRKSFVCEP